jgi:ABC-type antimicrobial peptide transport system permease subunit
MNPTEVTIIVAVAIISSIIGALVPAIRAARMHPVEALRWE